MWAMRAVVLCVLLAHVAADARCRVSKVRAVCESRCESEVAHLERVSVPPPGTLMPPSNLGLGVDEGSGPIPGSPDFPTPADSTSLLQTSEVVADPNARLEALGAQQLSQVTADNSNPLVHKLMTCTEVEAHINPVPLLGWTDINSASFGCVDGRSSIESLGTWGGDIAEMATALNVYEQMASIHLSQSDVTTILRKFLETTPRQHFTTCMSGLAIRQLFGSVDDLEAAIRLPAEELRASLWLKIADPALVGNEHLGFMLSNPSGYAVRKELVEHLIHSFFGILWNPFDPLHSRLRVQVLNGNHAEQAVVSVTSPEYCTKGAGLIPLISPKTATGSVAIINPDAVQVLRRELSLFFSRDTTPVVRADEMNKRFNVLAAGQGALTKKAMYDRIPTFGATIL